MKSHLRARVGALAVLGGLVIGAIGLESTPPLWWDEGWTLCVARNWVERGHYGCLLAGEPAPPSLAGHFPVVTTVALSFRLFGVGIWQGRLVGLLFLTGALALLYYLTSKLYNRSVAIGVLIILFLLPARPNIHPLLISRQVLGEMPAVFYLLAGYTCFLLTDRKPLLFIPLALGCWGVALMTKAQVGAFWAASLIAPLVVVLSRGRWRVGGLLITGLLGSLGTLWLLGWGKQFLLAGHTLPVPPLSGLIDVTAVVLTPRRRLFAAQFALTIGLPTLLGLGYATWQWILNRQRSNPDNTPEVVRLMLLVLAGSWFTWFVLLSAGRTRYAFPVLFFASPFTAALLYDLTSGFHWRATVITAVSALKTRRFHQQGLKAVGAVVLITLIGCLPATVRPLRRFSDTSALRVAHFFNTSTPPTALIETYDSELFFLLERPYHYPPPQIHVELIRRRGLGQERVITYDPLTADPDYLVVGYFSRMWRLYDPLLATGAFRPLHTFGQYQIYERIR